MKKKSVYLLRALALCLLMVILAVPACAKEITAAKAQAWLNQFAAALTSLSPINDPTATADPARAGEYLLEYPFGTVTAKSASVLNGRDILAIDVRTPDVTDCAGLRVGMSSEEALGGAMLKEGITPLVVLGILDNEYGWRWAYVGETGVYGVEQIMYGGDSTQMTEYTLTYVIDRGIISAIRMKMAPATQAQAMEGMDTAREIAARQQGEVLAERNMQTMFVQKDNQIQGGQALGAEVASLVARLGEPQQIQTLPEGGGRILLYADAVITVGLDEYTGMEVVRGVSVSGTDLYGPRGLSVGFSVQEAAALFRCDQDVSSLGGALYLEGEALGEAPYGMLSSEHGQVTLTYASLSEVGAEVILEAGIEEGVVVYWRLSYRSDIEGGV